MLLIAGCVVSFVVGYGIAYILSSNKIHSLQLKNSQLEQYKDISELLAEKFKSIASASIKEEQADLRKQNQEALEIKLQPLSENLNAFMNKIAEFDKNEKANFEVFKENIKILEEKHKEITQETNKLTQALTLNQNIKGKYGEDLLSCILEKSGMQEHINYSKQYQTTSQDINGDDKNIRPDFVISLPNNSSLIIDSKLTLDSFIEYQDKKNKETKDKFKTALKKRIDDLADKNYHKCDGLIQPNFIMLYIPIETAVNLIYSDSDFETIVKNAYIKNILIVGTSSVLTAINLVKELWAMQNRNEHNQEIAEAGKLLYEAFALHFEELEKIEKQLGGLNSDLTKTINRYRTNRAGDKSILKQVERLKELGISTQAELPKCVEIEE